MSPATIEAVERILDLDGSTTPEERVRVADALRGRGPAAADECVALSPREAAARLRRTTARVRQLAQQGYIRRCYGGYDAASVTAFLRDGLPRGARRQRRDGAHRRRARA